MLINLTQIKFDNLDVSKKNELTEKFGSVLDFEIPIIVDENELENVALDYFTRISAALDSCSNEPKQNAVCMDIQTRLEKKIMNLLVASEIEVLLSCF